MGDLQPSQGCTYTCLAEEGYENVITLNDKTTKLQTKNMQTTPTLPSTFVTRLGAKTKVYFKKPAMYVRYFSVKIVVKHGGRYIGECCCMPILATASHLPLS